VLAEYRRRKNEERVLYLCPTRQLAHQVGRLAEDYGISATVSLPPDYIGLSQFNAANTVAITTYSALFNSKPKFEVSDVLILDDAHSAEDYLANMWSVSIKRKDNPDLYAAIIGLYKHELGDSAHFVLENELIGDENLVYAIAQPLFLSKKSSLIELFNAHYSIDKSWSYAWSAVRASLHACQIFYSSDEILIRPFVPPTEVHPPFANSKQRIFMSATLGAGGELERMSGVAHIVRVPLDSRRENSGRRLFLFPDSQLKQKEIDKLLLKALEAAKKSSRSHAH
jgi:Rad3-related DNA helicase